MIGDKLPLFKLKVKIDQIYVSWKTNVSFAKLTKKIFVVKKKCLFYYA